MERYEERYEIAKVLESFDERCLRIALLVIAERIEKSSVCTLHDFLKAIEIAKSYVTKRSVL